MYKNRKMYFFFKRLLDTIIALVAFILLLPLFLVLIVLVKLDSKGPAIYVHKRVGLNGKELRLYKFRSMTTKYNTFDEFYQTLSNEQKKEWQANYKLENDPRITRIGKILRKTSLDELPQLVNIIKGEMSFVGPRPLVENELKKYGNHKDRYLSVLPGLTGYWAVHGRSNTTYDERMNMELYYVDHCNIGLDIHIFLDTFMAVLRTNEAS